jgi:hypothetical protein
VSAVCQPYLAFIHIRKIIPRKMATQQPMSFLKSILASLTCEPIQILPPVGVNDALFFVGWKLSGPGHSAAIAGELCCAKHVSVIALGTLNLITKAFEASRRKLQDVG